MKLSFVIPVYNAAQYLNKCVDSILNSKSKDIEVILIDDGSTDKSPEICDKYAKENDFVKVIHQTNAGVAAARNKGIKESYGDYIFFVDNDDWVDSLKIENLLKILDEKKVDLVINRSYLINEAGDLIRNDFIDKNKINNKSTEDVINYFIKNRVKLGAPWQYVFKKEIVVKNNLYFKEDQNGVDDSYFSSVLFINCKSFYLNENIIYFWRQIVNSQGKTHDKKSYIIKMISSIKDMGDYIDKVDEEYKKSFLYFNIYKNIYSLLGQYKDYSDEDKVSVHNWYLNNKKLIDKSVQYSGVFHRVLNIICGGFNGTILSYKLAILKSRVYAFLSKK